MKKIINKTPHQVYILDKEDHSIVKVFPKSKGMIRVKEIVKNLEDIEGISITSTSWSKTIDVPDYKQGIYYIVSQLVKNAMPNRKDFLVPKGAVRDSEGNVIGCTTLDIGHQN